MLDFNLIILSAAHLLNTQTHYYFSQLDTAFNCGGAFNFDTATLPLNSSQLHSSLKQSTVHLRNCFAVNFIGYYLNLASGTVVLETCVFLVIIVFLLMS